VCEERDVQAARHAAGQALLAQTQAQVTVLAQEAAELREEQQRWGRHGGGRGGRRSRQDADSSGGEEAPRGGGEPPASSRSSPQPLLPPGSPMATPRRHGDSGSARAAAVDLHAQLLRARAETHAALQHAAALAARQSAVAAALQAAQAQCEQYERLLSDARASHARAALGEARALDRLQALRARDGGGGGSSSPDSSRSSGGGGSSDSGRGGASAGGGRAHAAAAGAAAAAVAATAAPLAAALAGGGGGGGPAATGATLSALAAENDVLRSELRRLLVERAGLQADASYLDARRQRRDGEPRSDSSSPPSAGDDEYDDDDYDDVDASSTPGRPRGVAAAAAGDDAALDPPHEERDDRTASLYEIDELLRGDPGEGADGGHAAPLPRGVYSPMQAPAYDDGDDVDVGAYADDEREF
jgi:hypothetical protein